MVTISEGARMIDGEVKLRGRADAYGHRKLGGIGLETGERLRDDHRREDHLPAALLPHALGHAGRPGPHGGGQLRGHGDRPGQARPQRPAGAPCKNGTYTDIPLSTIATGQKRVDVDELYDAEAYRPRVRHVLGKPMFLY